jgi:MFS family permease
MVLHSTRWLALSYFTYFFSYGIFLPFWSVWLKGIGLTPETIGVLLGAGLVARFLGSLLIAPRVSDPSLLIKAVRILALLTLVFVACFWVSHQFAWLMVVMVGFNLFFSPLVPLTDALANTWQKQITMDYGRVRLWGSIAFVIGSALVGKLVSLYDYRAILALLSIGIASMLLGMLLRPSVMPQGESRHQESAGWPAWRSLVAQSWRFLACVCLQRHLLAGGGIFCFRSGLSVVVGGSGRSHYLCPEQEAVPSLWRARPAAAFRRVRRGALGHYGLDDRSAVADSGANSSLRHLYRVPSGGHALYRCARGWGRYSPAGRLFGGCNGGEYRDHDGLCGVPLPAPGAWRILGNGAGRLTRYRCSP